MDIYISRVINIGLCEQIIYIVSRQKPIYKGDAVEILSDIMILKVQVRINVLLEDKIYPKL